MVRFDFEGVKCIPGGVIQTQGCQSCVIQSCWQTAIDMTVSLPSGNVCHLIIGDSIVYDSVIKMRCLISSLSKWRNQLGAVHGISRCVTQKHSCRAFQCRRGTLFHNFIERKLRNSAPRLCARKLCTSTPRLC
jgi:hypothetical protein